MELLCNWVGGLRSAFCGQDRFRSIQAAETFWTKIYLHVFRPQCGHAVMWPRPNWRENCKVHMFWHQGWYVDNKHILFLPKQRDRVCALLFHPSEVSWHKCVLTLHFFCCVATINLEIVEKNWWPTFCVVRSDAAFIDLWLSACVVFLHTLWSKQGKILDRLVAKLAEIGVALNQINGMLKVVRLKIPFSGFKREEYSSTVWTSDHVSSRVENTRKTWILASAPKMQNEKKQSKMAAVQSRKFRAGDPVHPMCHNHSL